MGIYAAEEWDDDIAEDDDAEHWDMDGNFAHWIPPNKRTDVCSMLYPTRWDIQRALDPLRTKGGQFSTRYYPLAAKIRFMAVVWNVYPIKLGRSVFNSYVELRREFETGKLHAASFEFMPYFFAEFERCRELLDVLYLHKEQQRAGGSIRPRSFKWQDPWRSDPPDHG